MDGSITTNISIHALREEGDRGLTLMVASAVTFLSTPSVRRATCHGLRWPSLYTISIHALREEGDRSIVSSWQRKKHFYPRPP